jgi:hypothetical protein
MAHGRSIGILGRTSHYTQTLRYSSYYIAHRVEPLFPFDLAEATYMVPTQDAMSTANLIALRTRQLQKRSEDLELIKQRVIQAGFDSIQHYESKFANTIKTYDFKPGNLVLI